MLYRQNIHSWDGHGQCSSSKSHRGHGNMGCFENRMHPKNHYGVLYSLNQNGHKQDFWLNGILWPYVICDFDSINREPIQSSSIFRQTYFFFADLSFRVSFSGIVFSSQKRLKARFLLRNWSTCGFMGSIRKESLCVYGNTVIPSKKN